MLEDWGHVPKAAISNRRSERAGEDEVMGAWCISRAEVVGDEQEAAGHAVAPRRLTWAQSQVIRMRSQELWLYL